VRLFIPLPFPSYLSFTLKSVRKTAGPLITPSISCSSRRVIILRGRDRILCNIFSHFSRSAKPFRVGFFDTSAGHPTSVTAVVQYSAMQRHKQRFVAQWIIAFCSHFSLSRKFLYFLSHLFVSLFVLFNPLSFLTYFSAFSARQTHTTTHISA